MSEIHYYLLPEQSISLLILSLPLNFPFSMICISTVSQLIHHFILVTHPSCLKVTQDSLEGYSEIVIT